MYANNFILKSKKTSELNLLILLSIKLLSFSTSTGRVCNLVISYLCTYSNKADLFIPLLKLLS